MSRYSIIHPAGVKPPSIALSAEAWRDLEPATSNGTKFEIKQADGQTLTYWAKDHTEQVLRTLTKRPVLSASRCRISQYTSEMRNAGINIDTEGFRDHPTTGQRIYGMYVLRDAVSPFDEESAQ